MLEGDASENTGFVDFPKEFSGLSTSLGGLKPFAPASTSSGSATTNNDDGGPTNERFPAQGELTEGLPHDEFSSQDPPIRSNIRLTPGLTENSEEKYTTFDGPVGPSRHRQTFNDHDNGFRHGPSEKAPSFRVAQDFSDFRDFSDISANLPTSKIKKLDGGATDNVTPSRSENKKLRRPSTSDNDFSGIIRDSPSPSSNAEPRNQFPSAFNGDSGGYGDSFIVQPFSVILLFFQDLNILLCP